MGINRAGILEEVVEKSVDKIACRGVNVETSSIYFLPFIFFAVFA
jgi:hypothetical protein